jgi:hypothetical protein
MDGPARRVARAQLLWSTVALAAFLAAFAFRLGDYGSPLGIGLTAAGTVAVRAGGYLGSALVTYHRVGLVEGLLLPDAFCDTIGWLSRAFRPGTAIRAPLGRDAHASRV